MLQIASKLIYLLHLFVERFFPWIHPIYQCFLHFASDTEALFIVFLYYEIVEIFAYIFSNTFVNHHILGFIFITW